MKNDYFVIVYKILQHLYESLKNDAPINWDEMKPNSDKFPVNQDYWDYIWRNMYQSGLITGVIEVPMMGRAPGIKRTPALEITPEGIRYLEENSMMKKARKSITALADLITIIY